MAGLLDFMNSPAGMGLLSAVAAGAAGARKGTPWNNVGRGALGGLAGYSQAQDQLAQQDENAFTKQMKQMQMDQMQRQAADQMKMRESLQALYKPAGTEQFQADNPFGEDLGTLQNETPASFGGKPVDPVMGAVLPYAQPDDILKMFSPNHQQKTAEQKNWEFAQNLPEDQRAAFMGSNSTVPASVAEWQFYNQLPPDKQPGYLEMKRNPQIMNLGDSMAVRAQGGGVSESYAVAPKITDTPQYQAAQERAKGTARADVEAATTAKTQAPANVKAVSTLERLDVDIQSVIDHPGLKYAVGPYSVAPIIPGTPQADAFAAIQNLADRAAVGAINEMKAASKTGGAVGAVSEKEWPKLEAQMVNVNRAQSYTQFKKELKKFQDLVRESKRQINAAQQAAGGAPKAVKKYNPATGRIE